MDMFFTIFEEVYFQHYKYSFLSKEVMNSWNRTIKNVLNLPYAKGYWKAVKNEYPEGFRKYMD